MGGFGLAGRFVEFFFLQERLNKNLLKNQFAIWRVPAPWLPRTRKAVGAKPGSGKGNIHHYVTPVRAKRIILEVGGHIMELEVNRSVNNNNNNKYNGHLLAAEKNNRT